MNIYFIIILAQSSTFHFRVICEALSTGVKSVSVCVTSAVLGDVIFSQQFLQMSSEILERQGFSTGTTEFNWSSHITTS